jgi:hypothetical protein
MPSLPLRRTSPSEVSGVSWSDSQRVTARRETLAKALAWLFVLGLLAALCHIGWRMTEPAGDAPINGGARGTDG